MLFSSIYEVIKPYNPEFFMPDELVLEVGDIHVTTLSLENDWFVGRSIYKEKSGRFPANCVKIMPTNDLRLLDIPKELLYKDGGGISNAHVLLKPVGVGEQVSVEQENPRSITEILNNDNSEGEDSEQEVQEPYDEGQKDHEEKEKEEGHEEEEEWVPREDEPLIQ
jgi:hypothetical protein